MLRNEPKKSHVVLLKKSEIIPDFLQSLVCNDLPSTHLFNKHHFEELQQGDIGLSQDFKTTSVWSASPVV